MENPEAYPLGYVEDFSVPRAPLETFFSILLALPLLVPWIIAQHPHDTFSANHFAFRTNRFNRRLDLHFQRP
jgi:hypothetical protein